MYACVYASMYPNIYAEVVDSGAPELRHHGWWEWDRTFSFSPATARVKSHVLPRATLQLCRELLFVVVVIVVVVVVTGAVVVGASVCIYV